MKKWSRKMTAAAGIAVCLTAACAVLYHPLAAILAKMEFWLLSVRGTSLEFKIDSPQGTGFHRDVTIYTENGLTKAAFTGIITVDGTAEILIAAKDGASVLYQEQYTDVKAETIRFQVDNLSPYAYYTFQFSSGNAKEGRLLVVTDESLAERPEPPPHPKYPAHNPPKLPV